MPAIIKNRRSGREGQANGKCKCRWGFNDQGVWGKVFKTCGKPVDFHIDEKTGRKIWHLTCLACRTQQAKHFGTTVKVAKVAKVAKPKAAVGIHGIKVAKPKAAKVAKAKIPMVAPRDSRAGLGHYLVATPKAKTPKAKAKATKQATFESIGAKVEQLQAMLDELMKAA